MPSVNAESSYEKITFVMAPYYSQFDTPSTTAQLQAKVDDPKFDLSIPNVEIVTNTKTTITQNAGY
jgi:hypothetical protein